jgi:hypothetical protein
LDLPDHLGNLNKLELEFELELELKRGKVFCFFCFSVMFQRNKIIKDIIKAKRPTASVKANPKIPNRKSSSFIDGLLEIPKTKAPKTTPTPTPAPTNPIVASPAPTNFEPSR